MSGRIAKSKTNKEIVMPNRDKTGPRGEGAGTGGGRGGCTTEKQLEDSRKDRKDNEKGVGRGGEPRGGGRGHCGGRRKGKGGITYFT